ncbi:MAG: hypothetical protein IKY70_04690 [Bacteroidales bacterium]|nr:hypothetical protein [Bacteroidales bacterium]
MKKTFHLCLSAADEVMFRDLEDYNRGFNCFALALYKTNSTGLVEAFMSTHTHQLVETAWPKDFMHSFRLAYSVYFNHKYQRKGRLGELDHFTLDIVGHHHFLAAASYVLRNPLHHGVAPVPYAYPHCSANAIFRREMGKFIDENIISSQHYGKFLGRRAEFPSNYKMTESGVFTRESVLDIAHMEDRYGTPRAFNFYMGRKSSKEWETEQQRDANGEPPVNLASIESGVNMHDITRMSIFENGKSDYRRISDIELCTELDTLARNEYGKVSVYQLSLKEKEDIAESLFRVRHISKDQIRRCLVLPE